jgi:outer membrane protein TolC
MRFISTWLLFLLVSGAVHGQQTITLNLRQLVDEALRNNPEIRASLHQADAAHAKVGQAGTLDVPELTYMREEMPGFRWNEASMQKIELMQMFRFPSKLSKEMEIAEINAEHSHHEHYEKELEIITRLKSAYYELWFVQQSRALNQENSRLLQQFVSIAKTKFGVGDASLQDVLKANVELAKLENQGTVLQQQEQSVKAMLIAILNRQLNDSLGIAALPDSLVFTRSLDTLQQLALGARPMLLHDSLMVEESRAMLSLSRREYLPDLKLGIQYVTAPMGDFRGWSIVAGVSLPFAPWTLGKANSRVDEATATVSKSSATLNASRNMVLSNVKDLYYKVQSAKRQI